MDIKTEEELRLKFPDATFVKGIRSLDDLLECDNLEVVKHFAVTQYNKYKELEKIVDVDIKNLSNTNESLVKDCERYQSTITTLEKVVNLLIDKGDFSSCGY